MTTRTSKLQLVEKKLQLAEVIDIADRYQSAVVRDLTELMRSALNGEIIGLSYAAITNERAVHAGLSGILAKDRLKAAGVMFGVAMRIAEDLEE